MSEGLKIVLTAAVTVLTGTFLLVFGEIVTKFVIEPIHDQSRLRGEIADSLTFYANVFCNPGVGTKERMDEASEVLRRRASQLRAKTAAIPKYGLWAAMGIVPNRSDIKEAAANLIGLSNAIHQGDPSVNDQRRKSIEQQLCIDR